MEEFILPLKLRPHLSSPPKRPRKPVPASRAEWPGSLGELLRSWCKWVQPGLHLLLWTPGVGRTALIHLSLHLQVLNRGSPSRIIDLLFRVLPPTPIPKLWLPHRCELGIRKLKPCHKMLASRLVSPCGLSCPLHLCWKALYSPVSDILIRMCEKRSCLPIHSLSNQLKYPDLMMKGGQGKKKDKAMLTQKSITLFLGSCLQSQQQRPVGTIPPFPHSG